jgi:hypothetical protein
MLGALGSRLLKDVRVFHFRGNERSCFLMTSQDCPRLIEKAVTCQIQSLRPFYVLRPYFDPINLSG